MIQTELPSEFKGINRFAIKAMLYLNGFAHIVIGLALATSIIMFTWLFFVEISADIDQSNMSVPSA